MKYSLEIGLKSGGAIYMHDCDAESFNFALKQLSQKAQDDDYRKRVKFENTVGEIVIVKMGEISYIKCAEQKEIELPFTPNDNEYQSVTCNDCRLVEICGKAHSILTPCVCKDFEEET